MTSPRLTDDTAAVILTERSSVPKPSSVRYPWSTRWARTGVIHLAEESVDFWVSPKAFSDALATHARRHALRVKSSTFSFEAEDGSPRTAVLFVTKSEGA